MGLFGSKEKHDLEVKQVTMTVGQAVADLRNEIDKRNEAIRSKIQGLQQEVASEKAQIEQLVNDLIAQEAPAIQKGELRPRNCWGNCAAGRKTSRARSRSSRPAWQMPVSSSPR